MLGDKDLDVLRLGIEGLEKLYKSRSFKTDQLVDLAASVHALHSRLKYLDEEGSSIIKVDLLKNNKSIVEGHSWMGQVKPTKVFRLDTAKVKSFLGKQLKRYGHSQIEYRLRFIPRG